MDLLDTLLDDLVNRAQSDPLLAGLAVMSEDRSDIFNASLQALQVGLGFGGKMGAALIWREPVLEELYPNAAAGPFEISLVATLLYDQIGAMNGSNGIGVKPMALCRRLRRFKNFAVSGLMTGLELDKPFIRPSNFRLEGVDLPALLSYDVRFKCRESDTESTARVAPVMLVNASGTITLSCATSGADIYYTADGSYPNPASDTALLYTTPFTIFVPTAIRACAYHADDIPSNPLRQLITP